VRIFLPPLRDRIDDLPLLVKHFLKNSSFNRDRNSNLKLRSISCQALKAMQNYRWPGNVRELLNVVERACSLADGDCIEIGDLPEYVARCAGVEEPKPAPAPLPVPDPAPVVETPAPAGNESSIKMSAFTNKTFKDAKEAWLSAFEGDYLKAVLERNNYNISRAARESEIDRKYLRKLMKKYDIVAPDSSDNGNDED
jgi:DNA-binding NtrC family response regulator